MQIKYKYYYGGDVNEYAKEAEAAYERLTAEREIRDPEKELPIREVFPQLDSWGDYLIANSKSTFWQMERAISKDEETKSVEIEDIWEEAKREGRVGEWLKQAEADESSKAMCYYMASLYTMFDPKSNMVDFRFYLTEAGREEEDSSEREEQELYE